MNLNGFENLPQQEKIRLINGYNALPEQGKLFLKEHCNPFYEKIIQINDLVGGLATLELIDSNRGLHFIVNKIMYQQHQDLLRLL